MRDRASLILLIFIILLVIILAQNGTLGTLLSSLSNPNYYSVTNQPQLPTVRPLFFATSTARGQVLPAPYLPTAYMPTAYPPDYVTVQPPNPPANNVPSGSVSANGVCVVPNGWVAYTVQAGDTLAGIASVYGLTAEQLASANCLQNPDLIYEGQLLAVPGTR